MASKFLDFNSEIEMDSQEFILLPEGDYAFIVKEVEQSFYQGESEKIGNGCPMVTLKLEIKSPKGTATVQDRLYLNEDLVWKLSSFFRCIGLKKHGEKVKMNWNAAIMQEGLCHIIQEKWIDRNGNEKLSNRVDKYLDPAPVTPNVATQIPTVANTAPTAPSQSNLPFEV